MCDYLRHAALRGYAIGLNAGSYLVQTASDGGCDRVHGFGARQLERQLTSEKVRYW